MSIFFVLSTIILGLLCSTPALIIGYWLDKKGWAAFQPYLTPFLYICALFWIRLAAPHANLIFVICILLITSPLIYTRDFWFTYKWGKWWWKPNISVVKDTKENEDDIRKT